MEPSADSATAPLPVAENLRRTVGRLRLGAGLLELALVLVAATAALGMVVRARSPVAGALWPVVLAVVVALAALAGGAVALELTARKVKKAKTLPAAATWYKTGCLIAGGANLVAACLSLVVLFANGISGRLWLPQVLALAANLLGLFLAIPRLKHLARFHQRAILPIARL